MRGVPASTAEDVASHSHSTTILTLLLATQVELNQDLGRLLTMALIHDLPEALIGDIPRSAQAANSALRIAKNKAEDEAMSQILGKLPRAHREYLTKIWKEYHEGSSLSARIVEAADQLATLIHAAQLVKSGYPAELFSPFLVNAEGMLQTLKLPVIDELLTRLRQILPHRNQD